MLSLSAIQRVLIGTLLALPLVPVVACETFTPPNQIGELPSTLQPLIPKNMGVEAFSLTTLANGSKLAAAILTPKKWFVPEGRHQLTAKDPHERILVFWQQLKTKWEPIGRSSKILYTIDSVKMTGVQLSWTKGLLHVRQDMWTESIRAADEFILMPNTAKRPIKVVAWTSTYLVAPSYYGNGDTTMLNKLVAAKAKYGKDKACEQDGYSGTIDYTSGKILLNRCEYAKPKRTLNQQISSQWIALNQFKPTAFDRQKGMPK